ncbi:MULTISPECIES: geranylgeranyl reductase family protein [unclassified Actinotalea]|uniref:geranylgeranyl reductase family protein n=1 Tax=unclassified Actinotalea TaxID=2638618 RepID=UPI0015F3934C|nr:MULTISPECIES: geranylgeranyl reductase family protein [unclassified Actinotalea]
MGTQREHDDADVIVVGAGPAGSTAAYYLAVAGLDVLVLEKTAFPREKVCGDGFTPRSVRELVAMGVPMREEDGWIRNKGLRVYGGGHRIELPWPETDTFPSYGVSRTRKDFDDTLARHARAAGATIVEQMNVTGPVLHERTGRVVGVTARPVDAAGRRAGDEVTYRAPVVIAADGVSARLALALGIEKNPNRPMGVAVRTYYQTPRHDDDWMESWLELWDGKPGESNLLPGYGWIFGLGDGTANVGLGSVSSRATATKIDYKDLLQRWVANTPAEWGFTPENQVGPVRSAALPMGFNRKPHYTRGLMLVGDAGGMVSPFNGEGIAYAMQAARRAAEVVAQAHSRGTAAERERTLASYPRIMSDELGGYYTLGRVFVKLIEHPEVMRVCTRYGLPRPALMRLVLKLLSDVWEPRGGDLSDRFIHALTRIAPAA